MYCRNCGSEIDEKAAICVKCGFSNGTGEKFCSHCGSPVTNGAAVCMNCGFQIKESEPVVDLSNSKSKMTAGLLGIFLGGFGVHNFYLGYTGKAIAQIVLTLCCGVGAIWGFIEGILIFSGQINKDAKGVPLK